jgi:hypothetical protein
VFSIYAYEAMASVLDAIKRASESGGLLGDTAARRKAVVDAYFDTVNRRGLFDTYSIDQHGDTTLDDYGAFQIKDGALVPAT